MVHIIFIYLYIISIYAYKMYYLYIISIYAYKMYIFLANKTISFSYQARHSLHTQTLTRKFSPRHTFLYLGVVYLHLFYKAFVCVMSALPCKQSGENK